MENQTNCQLESGLHATHSDSTEIELKIVAKKNICFLKIKSSLLCSVFQTLGWVPDKKMQWSTSANQMLTRMVADKLGLQHFSIKWRQIGFPSISVQVCSSISSSSSLIENCSHLSFLDGANPPLNF